MISVYIYFIGCIVALILGLIILFKEDKENKKEFQPEILCPLILMSWLSVLLLVLYKDNKSIF